LPLQAGLLDQTPQREGGLRAIEALLRSKNGTISAAGMWGRQAGGHVGKHRSGMPSSWALVGPKPSTSPTKAAPHRQSALRPLVLTSNRAAEWRECVPEREQQRALLSKGVLRFDGRQLTFASHLAATYAGEALRARLPHSVAEQHKQLKAPGWW